MPKYTFSKASNLEKAIESDEESGYESDENTYYKNESKKPPLGQGIYALARKFTSADGLKAKAVLSPINDSFNNRLHIASTLIFNLAKDFPQLLGTVLILLRPEIHKNGSCSFSSFKTALRLQLRSQKPNASDIENWLYEFILQLGVYEGRFNYNFLLDEYNHEICDEQELATKKTFFETLYPEANVQLIQERYTYRLILPLFPGVEYGKVSVFEPQKQAALFLSAVCALKAAHQKGVIILDLKQSNILYDKKTNQSFLIDGGLSIKKECILGNVFKQPYTDSIMEYYEHTAPECWNPEGTKAKEAMDVYSLGRLIKNTLVYTTPTLSALTYACLKKDPGKRINLADLESKLKNYQDWLTSKQLKDSTVSAKLTSPKDRFQKFPHSASFFSQHSSGSEEKSVFPKQPCQWSG